jgi:peptide-methionine (R)-S-oxide reductase
MNYAVAKTEEQWREELGAEQYAVLRQAATERPWTGEHLDEHREGLFTCAACGAELFQSGTKFDSSCGWPSFYESVRPEAVELLDDNSLGMHRTEVRCAACGSHLGHVFDDGFGTPTGNRYCMNSLSLGFAPAEDAGSDATGSDASGTATGTDASASDATQS